jgi:uncharacterized membrane protein YdjX (TVP38/TMEM64 family)
MLYRPSSGQRCFKAHKKTDTWKEGKKLMGIKKNIKIIVLVMIVGAFIVATFLLPVKDWLINGLEWTRSLGIWGPVFVVLFYIVACILFLPGSVLTLGAGFIFGVVAGTITVSIGSTLGACAAFLVGRTIAREWIAKKIGSNEKFNSIDEAVGQKGFKIVFLVRLSPIFPFNLLNYAFGLTKVSFAKYALASWIGMVPGTLMFVYFGAGVRSLADVAAGQVETGAAGQIFFWFGMAATIVVTVFVTHVARKAISDAVGSATDEQTDLQ